MAFLWKQAAPANQTGSPSRDLALFISPPNRDLGCFCRDPDWVR